MKNLFLYSLALITVACYKAPEVPRVDTSRINDFGGRLPGLKGEFVLVASEPLAAPDAQGVSRNKFSAPLDPNDKWKRLTVPFTFDAGDYKSIQVSIPKINGRNCHSDPKLSSEKGAPIFYTTIGTNSQFIATNFVSYDKKIEFPAGTHRIEIGIVADQACTLVEGEFDVQFSK